MLILVCHSVLYRCELENNQAQIVFEVYYFNAYFLTVHSPKLPFIPRHSRSTRAYNSKCWEMIKPFWTAFSLITI